MSPPSDPDVVVEPQHAASVPRRQLRLTNACSNRCMFCFEGDQPRERTVDEEQACADIDTAHQEGARWLILTGGEPTLHPRFAEIVRHGKRLGLLVQVLTNGVRFAEHSFFDKAVAAGLDRITFSLHGHSARLHDRLTRTPGSFDRLMSGMRRAAQSASVVVTTNILVNRLNVKRLDRIVDLSLATGAREVDLLQIEPFGRAFHNRSTLLYDPAEHLDALHGVFRLARHPELTLRTSSFPPGLLEGFEELMEDPARIAREVALRRRDFERYLETGEPLKCRTAERCRHCALELFCTSLDQLLADLHSERWKRWWIGSLTGSRMPPELPFGCTAAGVEVASLDELKRLHHSPDLVVKVRPNGVGRITTDPLPGRRLVLVATTASQAEAWLRSPGLAATTRIEIELNPSTARWLRTNRRLVESNLNRLHLADPERPDQAATPERGVPQPQKLFQQLGLPVRVSGLPPCTTPGATPQQQAPTLKSSLFAAKSGRLRLDEVTARFLRHSYRIHGPRCNRCTLLEVCPGLHINTARLQRLTITTPQSAAAWTDQVLRDLGSRPRARRLGDGAPPQPAAPRLNEPWRRYLKRSAQ